jgi:ABC-type glutathione transport system ATPase component
VNTPRHPTRAQRDGSAASQRNSDAAATGASSITSSAATAASTGRAAAPFPVPGPAPVPGGPAPVAGVPDEPLLRAARLSKRYRTRSFASREPVWALRDVSLAIRPGDRLGIVGESGSGKSTLARLLLALEEPTSGAVFFEGREVSSRDRDSLVELRRSVQIVFQDPLGSLDPRMRVGDSIAEPLRALRIGGDHGRRVAELLGAVGLNAAAARRYPHQFSGGQRQRIAIARALAPRPRALIADEAVSALDVSVRAQVLNLLDELVDVYGLTLVFISHDLGVVRHVCTRVAVLYRGELVESGAADDVYEHPSHHYTGALLQAVPRLHTGEAAGAGRTDFSVASGGRQAGERQLDGGDGREAGGGGGDGREAGGSSNAGGRGLADRNLDAPRPGSAGPGDAAVCREAAGRADATLREEARPEDAAARGDAGGRELDRAGEEP